MKKVKQVSFGKLDKKDEKLQKDLKKKKNEKGGKK